MVSVSWVWKSARKKKRTEVLYNSDSEFQSRIAPCWASGLCDRAVMHNGCWLCVPIDRCGLSGCFCKRERLQDSRSLESTFYFREDLNGLLTKSGLKFEINPGQPYFEIFRCSKCAIHCLLSEKLVGRKNGFGKFKIQSLGRIYTAWDIAIVVISTHF